MNAVHCTLPATTANLGAGFDALGLALDLRNELWVCPAERDRTTVEGEGADTLPTDGENLVRRAMGALAQRAGRQLPPTRLHQLNRIPLECGLGSSASAIVGGVLASNALLDVAIPTDELLDLAIELEGHPDNVVPCLRGGLMVCCAGDDGAYHLKLPPPSDLVAVLAIPDYTVSTERARQLLPDSVPREDALFNVARSALLVAAMATGEYASLRVAMQDRLHQPYRAVLVPGLQETIDAALAAGASGAAMSGAGPTVVALVQGGTAAVEQAMLEALARVGVMATTRVAALTPIGAELEPADWPAD